MIEKYFIRHELTLKRYRQFKKRKTAMISFWVLACLLFFSATAELWANSKPILMKYHGRWMAPVFFDYHPKEFGREDIFVMDYRSLEFKDPDWAIWPVVQWNPLESNSFVESYPSAPTRFNIMGTDDRGRDVFARLLYGFRYSIGFALGVWILTYIVGTILGAISGYWGGRIDMILGRVVEVIEMTPRTLLLITMLSIFSPGILFLIIFSAIFDWSGIFYQMRAQFLQLRKREYVDAAKALGASHWRIIRRHIFPNALTPLVTFSPFNIAANISYLAILDYLGLGLRAPTPSWGELIEQGQKHITTSEWLVWYPCLSLLIAMVALVNIGLAVRDAFDSRSAVEAK